MDSRSNDWLASELSSLWSNHFFDVPILNEVFVTFGRNSKTRLGSIKYYKNNHKTTIITISGLLSDPEIPEYVTKGVLAHETVHYAHGFFSPLPQKYRHPHQGNIVGKELTKRGLSPIMKLQKQWLRQNWLQYIQNNQIKHTRGGEVIKIWL